LDVLADPHSDMPYVHIGFKIVLYTSSLFSIDSCDFLPISHCICLNLISSCILLASVCARHVRQWNEITVSRLKT
jgi:hypothetical protein